MPLLPLTRSETNAIVFPSGDQRASRLRSPLAVMGRAQLPSRLASQIWLLLRSPSRSALATVYRMRAASGEIRGSLAEVVS